MHSPYLVHYKPQRRQRAELDKKPHWTYVNPDYLTHEFAKTRNKLASFKDMDPVERPGFHEIKSLGGRIYEKKGYSREYIRMLSAHAAEKTTVVHYLSGGELQEHHFVQVAADLDIQDL